MTLQGGKPEFEWLRRKSVWTILKFQQDLLLLWNTTSKHSQSPFWLFQTTPNYPREFKIHYWCQTLREQSWELYSSVWSLISGCEQQRRRVHIPQDAPCNPCCSSPLLLDAVLHSSLGQCRAPCQYISLNSSKSANIWMSLLHSMSELWLLQFNSIHCS